MLSIINVILSCIAGYVIGAIVANSTSTTWVRFMYLLIGVVTVSLVSVFVQTNWATLDNPFDHLKW